MSLANIREKLAEKLEEIVGLTVSEYIPDTVTLPLACISLRPDKPVDYDFTAQNTSWVYHFQIQVLVNKGGSVLIAQKDLDKYIDPTNDSSIKAAIDKVDFGTDAAAFQLVGSPTFGTATYGSTDFLAIYFNLDIWCNQ